MDSAQKMLIDRLNELYAGEWLAMYQYWLGAKLAKNAQAKTVKELEKHAEEELAHAVLLASKIIELGGKPVISPAKLTSVSCCAYMPPIDPDVLAILKQNINGELEAISKYNQVLPLCDDQDTYNMIIKIRRDEEEHVSDLRKMKANETKGNL